KGIRITIVAAHAEIQGPQPARLPGHRDGNCPMKLSIREIKAVYLTCSEAEVSDQKMVAEPTKAGGGDRHPPGRREMVTRDPRFDEVSFLVKNGDRACTPLRAHLVRATGRRVGHKNIAADISNVERRETWGQFGVSEGTRPESDRIE